MRTLHLHEVQDGNTIEDYYTIDGTPYVLYPPRPGGWQLTVRRGPGVETCTAETRELLRRFAGRPMNADTARQISAWLQRVWARRVDLALTIGEAPTAGDVA